MQYFLPFYHVVSDEELSHLKHLYRIKRVKEFILDLEFFAKKFDFVDLETFVNYTTNGFPINRKKILHLTFDDGLKQCYSIIAPILKEKGIPATFFINSAFVDNKEMLYRMKISLLIEQINKLSNTDLAVFLNKFKIKGDWKVYLKSLTHIDNSQIYIMSQSLEVDFSSYLKIHSPYMTISEIAHIKKQGFSIGGHGADHIQFSDLSLDKQISQVVDCLNFLEDHSLLSSLRAFSFPFTDWGVKHEFFCELKTNKIADITFGTAGMKDDETDNNFQRVPMETGRKTSSVLRENFIKCFARKLFGINKVMHI